MLSILSWNMDSLLEVKNKSNQLFRKCAKHNSENSEKILDTCPETLLKLRFGQFLTLLSSSKYFLNTHL